MNPVLRIRIKYQPKPTKKTVYSKIQILTFY